MPITYGCIQPGCRNDAVGTTVCRKHQTIARIFYDLFSSGEQTLETSWVSELHDLAMMTATHTDNSAEDDLYIFPDNSAVILPNSVGNAIELSVFDTVVRATKPIRQHIPEMFESEYKQILKKSRSARLISPKLKKKSRGPK
jgi:hypothetical protein